MKHISPQLGFNNNVRHKGRVFHIQTEDSGIKHPHIITHLFADGGRILKSTKTSYAEFLGEEELAKKVRSLMQEQHKAMFIALRGGKFDQMLGDDLPKDAADKPAASASAEVKEAPLPPPPRAPMGSIVGATEFASQVPEAAPSNPGQSAREAAPPEPPPPAPAPPPPERAPPPAPPPSSPSSARLAALAAMDPAPPPRSRLTPPPPRAQHEPQMNTSPLRALASRPPVIESNRPPPMSPRTNRASVPPMATAATQPALPRSPAPPSGGRSLDPQVPPLSASLELDLEALERAAEQSQAPVYKQIRDLPPPPSALLKPSPSRNPQLGNTSYRSVTPQATQILSERAEAERPRPKAAEPPASNRGKYAPSRPASIFGASRPSEGSSIFGEDMISEKSLDEVILSYLAEDLEGGAKK